MSRPPGRGDWLMVASILAFFALVFGVVVLVWVIVGTALGR